MSAKRKTGSGRSNNTTTTPVTLTPPDPVPLIYDETKEGTSAPKTPTTQAKAPTWDELYARGPEQVQPITFTESAPQLSTYDMSQRLAQSWLPETLTKEEEAKRLRGASQVQSIAHLGEAFQAFANLGGTMGGAAPQKVASAGTIPLAEWTKRQEDKRREASKALAEAQKQDYAEYKSDYQNWLARKKAVDDFNRSLLMANAKESNAWNMAAATAKQAERAQIEKYAHEKELQKDRLASQEKIASDRNKTQITTTGMTTATSLANAKLASDTSKSNTESNNKAKVEVAKLNHGKDDDNKNYTTTSTVTKYNKRGEITGSTTSITSRTSGSGSGTRATGGSRPNRHAQGIP